jgi:hypothetical protein
MKESVELIELKSLTVINLVDNESDGMSSSCACIQPIPNNSAQKDDHIHTGNCDAVE